MTSRNDQFQPHHFYHAVRIALGLIYFHFGVLKFFPGTSPAESLAGETITMLTLGTVSPSAAVLMLAIVECGLGVMLLLNFMPRLAYVTFLGHMAGTFSPILLMPELTFNESLLTPTLEGQYILKNITFVLAVSGVFIPQLFPTNGWLARFESVRNRLIGKLKSASPVGVQSSSCLADER